MGEFAAHLGVSRPHFSKPLNQRAGITAEMDIRLSEALGQPPGLWLRMQTAYDLWQASQKPRARRTLTPSPPSSIIRRHRALRLLSLK